MSPKSVALIAIVGGIVLTSCGRETTNPATRTEELAPFERVAHGAQATDRYIVVLWDTVPSVRERAQQLAKANGGSIRHIYEHALRGFSVVLPSQALDALRADPGVRYVEQVEAGKFRVGDHVTQHNPPWGLNRIDQRALPLDTTYTYGETGSAVHVYIIDTGIRTSHTEFGGRATVGFDARPEDNLNGQDCHGHGTHVAGIVGGQTYGVAKAVSLVAVKVNVGCLDSIDPDDFIAGIDWVGANRATPAVANISIWGPPDTTVDRAVNNSIGFGVTFAVIAGNANGDAACNYSPARTADAITVGATTSADARAGFSNVGTCVDIFAPGEGIISAWATSNTATQTLSGTSQASPHVAGVAALYLQRDPAATPSQVWSVISSRGTVDQLTNIGAGSPNLLLHSDFLEVSMSGPTRVCGTGTWLASPSGVGTNYTYRWESADNFLYDNWTLRGTGQSLTMTACPPFTHPWLLRVTATTEGGFHGSRTIILYHR